MNLKPLSLVSLEHFSRLLSESGLEKEPDWCRISLIIPLLCSWDLKVHVRENELYRGWVCESHWLCSSTGHALRCLYWVFHSSGLQESNLA